MPSLTDLLQQGSTNLWLFIPTAVALGALHGLEPGHSKTMMAAFIVAIRGTVGQAILLGLSATISHTLIVWIIALGGLAAGQQLDIETSEPWFQLASAGVMAAIALWMAWTTWRQHRPIHHHGHHHDHAHHHEGHEHTHTHDAALAGITANAADEHMLEHANDIQRRFANRHVTTGQIVTFGLTGGLIPCPAAVTVLVLCLQLKRIALGATLVAGFSIGLALTMVTVGVGAALGMRHLGQRWSGIETLASRAPYVSSLLILTIAGYIGFSAWTALRAPH
ncbi:MAG TPA: nickel/cobalt efflux transporter [Hyphomonadaceae bacterium]|nr:nickel/cobalt efflux transporter [Hyphomonadaceae bacterium]